MDIVYHKLQSLYSIRVDSVLDAWWGQFFASGSSKTIKNILTCLEYGKYIDVLEKNNTGNYDTLSSEVKLGLLYKVGSWYIKSNLQQHPLMKAYCENALQNGALSGYSQQRTEANVEVIIKALTQIKTSELLRRCERSNEKLAFSFTINHFKI